MSNMLGSWLSPHAVCHVTGLCMELWSAPIQDLESDLQWDGIGSILDEFHGSYILLGGNLTLGCHCSAAQGRDVEDKLGILANIASVLASLFIGFCSIWGYMVDEFFAEYINFRAVCELNIHLITCIVHFGPYIINSIRVKVPVICSLNIKFIYFLFSN